MPLAMTVRTTYGVEHTALEQFIAEEYPDAPLYRLLADTECAAGTVLTLIITGNLDKWHRQKVLTFAAGGYAPYVTQPLLEDLCQRERIPAGTYLVKTGA